MLVTLTLTDVPVWFVSWYSSSVQLMPYQELVQGCPVSQFLALVQL